MKKSNMYARAKTWNPFKGCEFDCIYCRPSFQQQSKRQMHLCRSCYEYVPHCHRKRLVKIPSADIVFVSGNGDLAFCPSDFIPEIIAAIRNHNRRCSYKTYYFQSKQPECLEPFIEQLPSNVILVTTLETNRDSGYGQFSKAPPPTERFQQFKSLKHLRKVVTIEPVMDFDLRIFSQWIISIHPEYVWLGLNSRPQQVQIPEPTIYKLRTFVSVLNAAGVEVRFKDLRGMDNVVGALPRSPESVR